MWQATREIAAQFAWFPCVVFGAHVVASRFVNAYETFPSLDIPMHLAGGVAIAYFLSHSLDTLENYRILQPSHGRLRLILVFALSCTAAVTWEFAEYVSDRVFDTGAQKGLEDTLLDMFLGMIGASAYLLQRVVRFGNAERPVEDVE